MVVANFDLLQCPQASRRGERNEGIIFYIHYLKSDSPAAASVSCILIFISSHQGLLCPMWVYSLPRSYWRRPFTHCCYSKKTPVKICTLNVRACSAMRKFVYDQDSHLQKWDNNPREYYFVTSNLGGLIQFLNSFIIEKTGNQSCHIIK